MSDKYSNLSDNPSPNANGSASGVPMAYDDDWAPSGYYDPAANDPERAERDAGNLHDSGAGDYAPDEMAAARYLADALDSINVERFALDHIATDAAPTLEDYRVDAAFDDEAVRPGDRE